LKTSQQFLHSATILLLATSSICVFPAYSETPTGPSAETITKILKENETKRPTDATVAQIQAVIDKEPKNYYARLVMGNTLDRLGLPMQAIEQYQLAVQYGPDSPTAIVELVKAQIGVGQKEAAMRLLKEAEKRFPNDREITFWMGNYYLSKGDFKTAEQHFDQVQKGGPAFFGMSTARAEIQLRHRRWGLASALATDDLNKVPNYPLGNAVNGIALFNLRRYRDAEPALKIAFINYPLKEDYAKRLAETCVMTGDLKVGLEAALVAIAVSSRDANPDNETKWVLNDIVSRLNKGYLREQVPVLSEKIDKQINNGRWHFACAEIFDANGLHDLAAVNYLRAFQLDPSQAVAAYRLANDLELYFQKYDEAVYYLSKAHAIDPKDTEITDRLERLQNRLPGRSADLAWQLKDLLRQQKSPNLKL
jgi:tetratricopeptide (TPR) repeat protein